MNQRRLRVYAHRGASRELPENTMPAFRRAIELGADALETDAHATRDGVVVISHDPDGARVFGQQRAIAECTFAEVSAWGMPSLEELVHAFPGVPLNVDLKAPIADLAVALLKRINVEKTVTLASFSSATLRRVRALGYAGATGLGRSDVVRLLSMPTFAQRGLFAPGGNAAQLPVSLARRWVVERCHALGLRVDYWTVNDPREVPRFIALGVDGIMTDDPAAIVPAVRASLQG